MSHTLSCLKCFVLPVVKVWTGLKQSNSGSGCGIKKSVLQKTSEKLLSALFPHENLEHISLYVFHVNILLAIFQPKMSTNLLLLSNWEPRHNLNLEDFTFGVKKRIFITSKILIANIMILWNIQIFADFYSLQWNVSRC